MNDFFKVKAVLHNNRVICEVDVDIREGDKFYYYLLRDGQVLDRVGWVDAQSYGWDVTEGGTYTVQAHIKRGGANRISYSNPVNYIDPVSLSAFEDFKSGEVSDVKLDVLPFYKSVAPYSDYVLMVSDRDICLNDVFLGKGFCLRTLDKIGGLNCQLIAATEASVNDSATVLFSGIAKHDSSLVIGPKQLSSTEAIRYMGDVGNFTMLVREENRLLLFADYFGVSKIYYYHKNGLFLASSRYHALLLALKDLRVPLTFNHKKVKSNFVFVNVQPFHQNFSECMEVDEVSCLPICKIIEVTNQGVRLIDSPIAADLNGDSAYSEELYKTMLYEAKEEILENVEMVLSRPEFDTVLIDLSGGMDSRMVYAAVTNFPEYKHKVKIASNRIPGNPAELTIATTLANMWGYAYNDLQEFVEKVPLAQMANRLHSNYLGCYYSYNLVDSKRQYLRAIRLSGMYGEIIARPYYTRSYLGTEYDVAEVDEFVNGYFLKMARYSILGGVENSIEELKDLFTSTLKHLPGKGALEKFENHYLFYRCGLHCSDVFRTDLSVLEWGPLQSKTMFKLKNLCYQKFKSIKLQLDMITLLNPVLGAVPFERQLDNDDKLKIGADLFFENDIFRELQVPVVENLSAWEAADKRRRAKLEFRESDDSSNKAQGCDVAGLDLTRTREVALSVLRYLLNNDNCPISNNVALAIYGWIVSNGEEPSRRQELQYLSNKLLSLAFQLKIISNSL